MNRFLLLFLVFFITGGPALGVPLGTIPTLEDHQVRFIFDFRSDMWTSPYTYKESPIQTTGFETLFPILKGDDWSFSGQLAAESLNLGRPDFHMDNKQIFVGSSLQSTYMGLGAQKRFSSGAEVSIFAGSATATDQPEKHPEDRWIEGNMVYLTAPKDGHRWMFAVNHSNNRGFLNGKPFAYFGLQLEESASFTASFGFPYLKLNWAEPEKWQSEFLLTPFGYHLQFRMPILDQFTFTAMTAYTVRSYLHGDRPHDYDRLYYQEHTAEANIRTRMTDTTGVLFGIGYAFDRRLYEAKEIYHPDSETEDFDDDYYARVAVEFRL